MPDLDPPLPADTAVLVLRSGVRLGERELNALHRLRHVVRTGSGIDRIDVSALWHRGITLHRNAEAGAGAVDEWVLAAALALARRIPLGQHALLLGQHEKQVYMGASLSTLAAGIWGAGPVGLAAEWALAPTWAARPSPRGRRTLPVCESCRRQPSWSSRRPLLICAGRLETLDVAACLRALADGRLSGLALDPVEREHLPLLTGSTTPLSLLASPHIGAQRSDVRGARPMGHRSPQGDQRRRQDSDRRRAPVNPSARLRREIADRVAQALLASGEAREVWLEGALACGFAHAASDIDLPGIVDGTLPAWESRIVDGVRVDLQATAPQRAEELRHLLRSFDVRRDDLGSFRRVHASMHGLMCLRTALSYVSGHWNSVLAPGERQGYRRWAVADQADGGESRRGPDRLVEDGLAESVGVVCRKLETCLAALDCAAASRPGRRPLVRPRLVRLRARGRPGATGRRSPRRSAVAPRSASEPFSTCGSSEPVGMTTW
ncbi:hypothetical protein [Streptomyces sp. NPDC019208]|uniref:hypothetical protein n=1 Tax=Streptomyces sp. NPDC019208 TaxID=3154683 RepID=UPI0033F89610